jgi:hypothetical protein
LQSLSLFSLHSLMIFVDETEVREDSSHNTFWLLKQVGLI